MDSWIMKGSRATGLFTPVEHTGIPAGFGLSKRAPNDFVSMKGPPEQVHQLLLDHKGNKIYDVYIMKNLSSTIDSDSDSDGESNVR
jgi:hypothetical protein